MHHRLGLWAAILTGAWTPARSWLVPALAPRTATIVASAFWIASLTAFAATALLLWFDSADAWQPIAIVSAVVSTVRIVLFFGPWPDGRRDGRERRGAGDLPHPALEAPAWMMLERPLPDLLLVSEALR